MSPPPSDVYFTFEDSEHGVLIRIAEYLFNEFLTLCRLTDTVPLRERGLTKYQKRLQLIVWYLVRLEALLDLRFTPKDLPFIGWHETSHEQMPIAGYLISNTSTPSQVCTSVLSAIYPGNQAKAALDSLRSAAYLTTLGSFTDGLSFLVNCHVCGMITGENLVFALTALIESRSLSANDSEWLESMLSGDLPLSNMAWRNVAIASQDILSTIFPADSANRTQSNLSVFNIDWFHEVLVSALDKIDEVRRASTYNRWLTRYFEVLPLVRATTTLSRFAGRPNLGLQAALSQLEEIKADTGILVSSLAKGDGMYSHGIFRSFGAFMGHIQMTGQQGVLERIMYERLLIPQAIERYINHVEVRGISFFWVGELPVEWHHVGWSLAHPVAAITGTARGFDPPTTEDHSRIAELTEKGLFDESIEASQELLEKNPWSAELYGELAIALDKSDRQKEALEKIITAIVLRPENCLLWISLAVILRRMNQTEQAAIAEGLGNEISTLWPSC
jgi:tetratricopeptide (TPR) repeat protein